MAKVHGGVTIMLADPAPKIINGYWHEWVGGQWVNTGVKAEGDDGKDGSDGKDGANYLNLGYWDATKDYYISDAGIPLVKVVAGTSAGFQVFKLVTSPAIKGIAPSTSSSSRWALVETAQFLYMQEAYIEKLQAELVTAERIAALYIETGNLKVTDGAEIGNLIITGSRLASKNEQMEIDGESSTVALRDQFGNIQTIIRPVNLPTTPSAYFASTPQKTASLSSFKVQKNGALNQLISWESNVINLSTSQGESYNISVPSLSLFVNVSGEAWGGMDASFTAILTLYLQGPGSQKYSIGSVFAFSTGGMQSDSVTLPPSQFIVTHGGNWRLRAELNTTMIGNGSIPTSSGTISGVGSQITADQIVNRSEIGNNGMVIATSPTNYFFEVGSLTEFRHSSNIFQVDNNYIRVSRNGGTSWTNL